MTDRTDNALEPCDPLSDPRVVALVDAAKLALKQIEDKGGDGYASGLDVALAALSPQEETMTDDPIKEAADWLAQDDATHWGEHEWRLFNVVEAAEELCARLEAVEKERTASVSRWAMRSGKHAGERDNAIARAERAEAKLREIIDDATSLNHALTISREGLK